MHTLCRVKLVDLHPEWVAFTPGRSGTALICDCPCGCDHSLVLAFLNPLDGGPPDESGLVAPRWTREGETFDDLTISALIRITGRNEQGERTPHWEGSIVRGAVWPAEAST
jgi:hypothetical protein